MYDALLGARGAAPHAEALQAPVLRLRLLQSLLHLVHLAAVRLLSSLSESSPRWYNQIWKVLNTEFTHLAPFWFHNELAELTTCAPVLAPPITALSLTCGSGGGR